MDWASPRRQPRARPGSNTATDHEGEETTMRSPVFVATFVDGNTTRMTTYHESLKKLDIERGKKPARHAYRSRTGKEAPEFAKAHFEHDGELLKSYGAIELDDEPGRSPEILRRAPP